MIPRECKRLAEVDFPIRAVGQASAKERYGAGGHPFLLHLWWARRPLASCRAMLLALLLPDPCDQRCPEEFKTQAREALAPVPIDVGNSDEHLREALLRFIGIFANWNLASDSTFLEAGRELVHAAHSDEIPLVVDPFAGGGSIPLEALRLGCEVFASELNPVACLNLKLLLEDIPRSGPNLANDLRDAGATIKESAEIELRRFYPKRPIFPPELEKRPLLLIRVKDGKAVSFVTTTDPREHLTQHPTDYTHFVPISEAQAHGPTAMTAMFGRAASLRRDDSDWLSRAGAKPFDLKWEVPIAYIWARTVRCEAPNCGAEIPLLRSLWLCKKAGRRRALRHHVVPTGMDGPPRVVFEIFVPTSDEEVHRGTVTRAKATCLCCETTLAPDRVRAQIRAQRGGADVIFDESGQRIGGAMMLAVVMTRPDTRGREYHLPTARDYDAVRQATNTLQALASRQGNESLPLVPDEPTPKGGGDRELAGPSLFMHTV